MADADIQSEPRRKSPKKKDTHLFNNISGVR